MKRLFFPIHSNKSLKFYILIIICLLLLPPGFAQKKIKVTDQSRFIEYYVLSNKENAGFFKKNEELAGILLNAALNHQINVFKTDYNTGNKQLITPEELAESLQKVDGSKDRYGADEVSLIGFDLTEGHNAKGVYYQYNYLNLYVPYYNSATTKNMYVGSFRFNEVFDLLDTNGILWYPESFGLSKGLLTNYGGFTLEQTMIGKKLLEDVKHGYLDASFNESINISTYNARDGYPVYIHIQEQKGKAYYLPVAMELHKARPALEEGEDSYICSIPFEEFDGYIKEEPISPLSNALLKQKLVGPSKTWRSRFENFYDPNLTDMEVISENGKFLQSDHIDPLSSGDQLILRRVSKPFKKQKFTLRQTELLDLSRPENEALSPVTPMIIKAILHGDLAVYLNDSLQTPMTLAVFRRNLHLQENDSTYVVERFNQIELIDEVSFDMHGENKAYRPLGLGILMPASQNKVETPQPIGYVRFEAMKEVLVKNAGIENSIQPNYLGILLSRDFKTFIKSSSHISMKKK